MVAVALHNSFFFVPATEKESCWGISKTLRGVRSVQRDEVRRSIPSSQ